MKGSVIALLKWEQNLTKLRKNKSNNAKIKVTKKYYDYDDPDYQGIKEKIYSIESTKTITNQ